MSDCCICLSEFARLSNDVTNHKKRADFMRTRTKIICTIGPAVDSVESLIQLIHNGMDVARLNFSHGSYDEHRAAIERLKEARKKASCPLAIMIDTRGPDRKSVV